MIQVWGVSPGHPGQLFISIFDILKRKVENLSNIHLKNCAQQNPSNYCFTPLDQPQGLRFSKIEMFFKPGMLRITIFPHGMAWRSLWINLLPKKQTNKRKKYFIFFPCFSPISWLHLLKLLWNHCILTKKIFWSIQVDFFNIIFHPRPLPDHVGKISVLMKNQGTSYLKYISNQVWLKTHQ